MENGQSRSSPAPEETGRLTDGDAVAVTQAPAMAALPGDCGHGLEAGHLFQSFMDNSPAVAFLCEVGGRMMFVNKPYERIFGVASEDVDQTPLRFFTPEVWADLESNDRLVLESGLPMQFVENAPTSDGVMHQWLTWKFPVIDTGGRRLIGGVAVDITPRIQVEEALKRSEMQFRLIWQNSRDGMRLIDDDGHIVMVNDSYCRMVGMTEDQLIGQRFSIIYAPEVRHHVWRSGVDRFRERVVEPYLQREYMLWDGRRLSFEVSNSYVELEGQRPRLLSIFRDVTERQRTDEALRHARGYSDNLIAAAPVLVAHLDRLGSVNVLNEAAERITGYTRAELSHRNWMRVLVPRDRFPEVWKKFRDRPANTSHWSTEGPFLTKSGEERMMLWNYAEVRERDSVVGLIAFGTDITEARRAQGALQRYQLLLEHTSDIMLLAGPGGVILEANKAAEHAYGFTRGELLAMQLNDLCIRDECMLCQDGTQAQDDPPALFQSLHQRCDGGTFPVEVSAQSIVVGGEPVVAYVIRDITERKRLEQELAYQAFHDPLTGLANRSLFLDRVTRALAAVKRRGQKVGILFLDLDRFKLINDSLGHVAGDQLLIAVAGRLQACLRGGDTAARFGGDEFTILLEDLNIDDEAARVAQRILKTFQSPFQVAGREFYVTGSVGIAVSQPDAEPDDLLKQADIAMYQAKEHGRSGYAVYQGDMHARVLERLNIETDLRRALERCEFLIYYQPIVHMESHRTIGLEALVRWQHPRLGLLPPEEFIPLQEQIGLIEPFTMWVLREVRRQCRAWLAEGLKMQVSVNLSALTLQDETFPEHVCRILTYDGLPYPWLKLEITESAMMQNAQRSLGILPRLAAMGVRLSIDDFGTGYSSLAYLRDLPVDEIKIDKSFIRDLDPSTPGEPVIVQATIDLAHTLRKTVVAEGVENAAVWDALRRLKCDAAQGYHMARPLPADELSVWLRTSPFGWSPSEFAGTQKLPG